MHRIALSIQRFRLGIANAWKTPISICIEQFRTRKLGSRIRGMVQYTPGSMRFHGCPILQFRATIPTTIHAWRRQSTRVASSSNSRFLPIRMRHNKLDNHSANPPPPRKILELQFRGENNSDPELQNQQSETRFFQQFLLRVISIIYRQCGMVFQCIGKTNQWTPDFSALTEMHKKMKNKSIAIPQIC